MKVKGSSSSSVKKNKKNTKWGNFKGKNKKAN